MVPILVMLSRRAKLASTSLYSTGNQERKSDMQNAIQLNIGWGRGFAQPALPIFVRNETTVKPSRDDQL